MHRYTRTVIEVIPVQYPYKTAIKYKKSTNMQNLPLIDSVK